METEIVLNVKVEPLEEGGFLAISTDQPGLVVQGAPRWSPGAGTQANARLFMEVCLTEILPLPPALRRVLKRKPEALTLPLPVAFPVPA